MNLLRKIYPLWLREKLYFHLPLRARWPTPNEGGFALAFAPVKLPALLPTDYGHRQIAWCGFYELDLSRRIAALARPGGGLLVDVGANVGYFSCLWAAANPANEAYAFEPSPRNLAMLRQNVTALDQPRRVKIFDHALGQEPGILNFDIGPAEQTGWGGLASAASVRTIQVKVCPLDDLIPADKTIAVLKIDTEGADTWVLVGAENLLRQKRIRHIFYEANLERMQQLGIQADEAQKFLTRLGYKVRPIADQEFYATPE